MSYSCCNRRFYSYTAWEQHTNAAATHRTCDICNVTLSTVARYEKHRAKVHGNKRVRYVDCNFCDRRFKSPSAYAQHIESGVHGVNRGQVTRAVHTLRVIPQITLAPPPQYNFLTTSTIEAVDDDFEDPAVPATNVVHQGADYPVEPGPPLNAREEEAAVAVTTEPLAERPVPTTNSMALGRRCGPERLDVMFTPTTYVPGDFVHQGIPYACPICLKTFRNVYALSSHMNSPVHDPDAFKCPKCKKHFRLVSGLIQHLESGACKLASPAEIYDRFAKLTARFSRLLTV